MAAIGLLARAGVQGWLHRRLGVGLVAARVEMRGMRPGVLILRQSRSCTRCGGVPGLILGIVIRGAGGLNGFILHGFVCSLNRGWWSAYRVFTWCTQMGCVEAGRGYRDGKTMGPVSRTTR